MKIKIDKRILALAVVFVTVLGGVLLYYFNTIQNLNNEVANLSSQISNLTSRITNLTTANLVTALGTIEEIPGSAYKNVGLSVPYDHLYIKGSVKNTGQGTAHNAGLHVVAYNVYSAYNAQGTLEKHMILEINMTVPLNGFPMFGTDTQIENFISATWGYIPQGSTQPSLVYPGQTVEVDIGIFHENTVSNWTVTPVWTNSP